MTRCSHCIMTRDTSPRRPSTSTAQSASRWRCRSSARLWTTGRRSTSRAKGWPARRAWRRRSSWPGISPGVRKWDSGPGMRRVEDAMLALVVIWGVNFPIVKIAFREMTPMVFNALRFGGATVLLLAVLVRAGEPIPPRGMWLSLVGLGLVGHAIYQVAFINGLARTTAGNSSLILAMVPLFV